ncbi:unnamed protein product [Choristocarpus tenellus]
MLTDTSFFEYKAVAENAPAVILRKSSCAVLEVVGASPAQVSKVNGCTTLNKLAKVMQAMTTEGLGCGSTGSAGMTLGISGGDSGLVRKDGAHQPMEQGVVIGWDMGSPGFYRQGLQETYCLVMLLEQFPSGCFAGTSAGDSLIIAESLDSLCSHSSLTASFCPLWSAYDSHVEVEVVKMEQKRDSLSETAKVSKAEVENALWMVSSSLRKFMKTQLEIELVANPPSTVAGHAIVYAGFTPGDSLLRVIHTAIGKGAAWHTVKMDVEGDLRGEERKGVKPSDNEKSDARYRLFQSSSALIPVLVVQCLAVGEDDAVLETVSWLGRNNKHRESWGLEGEARMKLLQNVLWGVVAYETSHLARMVPVEGRLKKNDGEDGSAKDEERDKNNKADSERDNSNNSDTNLKNKDDSLLSHGTFHGIVGTIFETIVGLVQTVPPSATAPTLRQPQNTPPHTPGLLHVWGVALHLSFLCRGGEDKVFWDERLRSSWVMDIISYLDGVLKDFASSGYGRRAKPRDLIDLNRMSEDRVAQYSLLRSICGCCHLLKPPLPEKAVANLVAIFLNATSAEVVKAREENGDKVLLANQSVAVSGAGCCSGDNNGHLMQTSFCLLVQHASEGQLGTIFDLLLSTLTSNGCVDSLTTRGMAAAAIGTATVEGIDPFAASLTSNSIVESGVSLLNLAVRAGRGPAFVAVIQGRVLGIVAAFCSCLQKMMKRQARDQNKERCMWRLGMVKRVLSALDGLLAKQPYGAVTARVVSVILGSVDPALRLCSEACNWRESGTHWKDKGFAVATCFETSCHIVGTVLQHYAIKVYSCTPPFISLCRSLLRIFYQLAMEAEQQQQCHQQRHVNTEGARAGKRGGSGQCPRMTLGQELIVGQGIGVDKQVATANALSRVLEHFGPHKEVLKRYAPFVLAEYVYQAGSSALQPGVREALLPGVFSVVDICTPREMQHLHTLLDATGKVVFRSLHEEYQRKYKYSGKV